MKHFFSFLLILSIFTTLFLEGVTTNARRHDSLTEAAALSFGQAKTISIPAHASKYFYFLLPASGASSNPRISFSMAVSSIKVIACDSTGNALSLSRTKQGEQTVFQFKQKLQHDNRYFIQLRNAAGKTVKCNVQLSVSENAATPQKTKHPTITARPHQTPSTTKPQTKPSSTRRPAPTKTTTKKTTTHSKTSFHLKTHFLRLKSNHSLALMESITDSEIPEVTLQCKSPDILSIQNGILYGKKAGIAVILIKTSSFTTSCTVKIN